MRGVIFVPQNVPINGDLSVAPFLKKNEVVNVYSFAYFGKEILPYFERIKSTSCVIFEIEALDFQFHLFAIWCLYNVSTILVGWVIIGEIRRCYTAARRVEFSAAH